MKAVISLLLCIMVCFFVSGCSLYSADTDALLSPPQLSGEMYPIWEAFNKSVSAEYDLKYPSKGNLKSAVVTEDTDNDGFVEAFAFYSTNDDEQTAMHINAIKGKGKEYKSVDDQKIIASGIEKIDFCDLDGDGSEEIIIGWEIYADSEKQLQIYDFSSGALVLRFSQRYTDFVCCDLDANGETELLLQELDTKNSSNVAALFKLDKKGVSKVAACAMDKNVKSVEKFEISTLSGGQPAVYIDEIKGIGAVTEVLFMRKGELVNPLLDVESSGENIKTLRASSTCYCDIDGDEIIEIPVSSEIPSADGKTENEFFYTNWCSFNGEILNVKEATVINSADGYNISVPARWINAIAISKDTENKSRTVYRYDGKSKKVCEKLITVKVFRSENFSKEKNNRYIELGRKKGMVYAAELSDYKGELAVSSKEIKEIFRFNDFS